MKNIFSFCVENVNNKKQTSMTQNMNFSGFMGGAFHPKVQQSKNAFESILGYTDKQLPLSLTRASEQTQDKKILADLWSAWDGFNW